MFGRTNIIFEIIYDYQYLAEGEAGMVTNMIYNNKGFIKFYKHKDDSLRVCVFIKFILQLVSIPSAFVSTRGNTIMFGDYTLIL